MTKVEVRISERQMRAYLDKVAKASVQGAGQSCAKAAKRRVQNWGLIDSGALGNAITSTNAGSLRGQGAIVRVYVDGTYTNRQGVPVGAYSAAQHNGVGPIFGRPLLYLKYRRNTRRKAMAGSKVWSTTRTSGIPAHPFLADAARALRERDFAYLAAKVGKPGKSTGGAGRAKTAAERVAETIRQYGTGTMTKGDVRKFYGKG